MKDGYGMPEARLDVKQIFGWKAMGVEWGVCWTRELEFHWKWWAGHQRSEMGRDVHVIYSLTSLSGGLGDKGKRAGTPR